MNRCRAMIVVLAAIGSGACTESDDVLREIGVTRLGLADSTLAQATLDDPKLQSVRWTVQAADLTLGGRTIDLLSGQGCVAEDTLLLAFPLILGKCASGIVIDAGTDPVPATLALSVRMYVRRVEQEVLMPQDDFDMDTIDNATDICPLVANPMQEDADGNMLGDACEATSPLTLQAALDSDGDGITDDADSCVQIPNNPPRESGAPAWPEGGSVCFNGCPDGIGDACSEQTASVTFAMSTDLRLDLDAGSLVQGVGQTSVVTVDFRSTDSLTCDWVAGTCSLDPTQVRACLNTFPAGC